LQVFITTGSEDIVIHIAVPSTEALRDFVLDSLTKRREVDDVRTGVVFDHERKRVVDPAPWRGVPPARVAYRLRPTTRTDQSRNANHLLTLAQRDSWSIYGPPGEPHLGLTAGRRGCTHRQLA
jgi:hypothetical protein